MSCNPPCQCECCTGTGAATPATVYNRPGLDAISYRIGEHGQFLETMKARLSSHEFPALGTAFDPKDPTRAKSTGLGSRSSDDPSIALLDGWAMAADVLTFYQERLANEGFLRTATDRRSVLELGRLVGYQPRPGVAATCYLAYEVDSNATTPVEIPLGAKVQSVPGPGELPQTFETSEKFIARKDWNAMRPRLERPCSPVTILEGTDEDPGARLYLKGINTGLKANDALLIQLRGAKPSVLRVTEVTPDAAADRTRVAFDLWSSQSDPVRPTTALRRSLAALTAARARLAPLSTGYRVLGILAPFLAWFNDQANASPVSKEVSAVLLRPNLLNSILAQAAELMEIAVSPSADLVLQGPYYEAVKNTGALPDEIEEYTGLPNGGIVGRRLAELAAELAFVDFLKGDSADAKQDARLAATLKGIVAGLAAPPSVPPRDSRSLARDPEVLFDRNSDIGTQAVSALEPRVGAALESASRNAKVAPESPVRVFAMRLRPTLFAASAPRKVVSVSQSTGVATTQEWSDTDVQFAEMTTAVHLDASYEKVKPGSFIILDFSAVDRKSLGRIRIENEDSGGLLIATAGQVSSKLSRAQYSVSGQTTRVPLLNANGEAMAWFSVEPPAPVTGAMVALEPAPAFELIRRTAVYAESEELALASEPVLGDICGGDEWIEMGTLTTGLESGRWLVVSGDRADIAGTEGVRASELVMLDAVRQYVQKSDLRGLESNTGSRLGAYLPGEKLHTFLRLARKLSYCYKRGTVTINANVVKATHGETRSEILGAGDATTPLQTFVLRQPPVTYVPANQPDGVDSTLKIYVNGVEWKEAAAITALGPASRGFIARIDDNAVTSVTFGDGIHGSRLPTGVANIQAIYRSGIGMGGNVKAGQLSQLMTRPLGIKGVNNPIDASGGADPETRDQARKNTPLAVRALDRLVGTQDYADFARTFAGIGKAASARLYMNGNETVFVTIAGANDTPVPATSDLYANLLAALRTYGDPYLPLLVESRELLLLTLHARIRMADEYLWDDVVTRVRQSLLDRYSFERRELGQSAILSEIIAAIQSQRGVAYVDIESFGAVAQLDDHGAYRGPEEITAALRAIAKKAKAKGRPAAFVRVANVRVEGGVPRPAQLAFFAPQLPDTLILNRIED
ncbi:MAG: putative baseplate assembly protein [Bryobacterales bacterium]|nr:putative baseplate assembly protein [Bryobacterales bacterium]